MNVSSSTNNFVSVEPIGLSELKAAIPDDISSFSSSSCVGSSTSSPPTDFEPNFYDIICGRGKGCANWVGNRRFRVTISMNKQRYIDAPSKPDKSAVVDEIVKTIASASPNGGFLKKDPATGKWLKMSRREARNKVAHAMRDAVQANDKKSKRRNRRRSALKKKKAATPTNTAIPLDMPSNPEVSQVRNIRRSLRTSLRSSFRGSCLIGPDVAAYILEALDDTSNHACDQDNDYSLASEAALFCMLQDSKSLLD